MNIDICKQSMVGLVRTALNAGLSTQIGKFLSEDVLDAFSDADLYYLAGNVRLREQDYKGAVTLFQRASELAPQWASPLNNAGICHERQGRQEDAYRFYSQAAERAPSDRLIVRNAAYAAFHHNDKRLRTRAADFLTRLLEHHPEDSELHSKLGYVYFYLGERDKALACARRAVDLNSQCVTGIVQKVAFHLPIVYTSNDEIDIVRHMVDCALNEMSHDVTKAITTSMPSISELRDVWCDPLFFLTYNGRTNTDLLSRFNDQVRRLMEAMFDDAQTRIVENRRARLNDSAHTKIRIGFVSAFFNGHSIWKIPTVGYYENLDRDRFEIHTYHMGSAHDRFTDDARNLSDAFFESTFVGDVIERLVADAPDVIVYPDVGMNFSSYCLTSLRLAPLQVQMLGHPDTSGSANVDYVVSADMMESASAELYYREKILRLPGLGCTYSFGYPQPSKVNRSFFGLDEHDIVIVSPQSTFKYVPEDDDLYPQIAARIGERCKFVFFPRSDAATTQIFVDRMQEAFQRHGLSYDRHVRCHQGSLSQPEFIALCAVSDVFLDNPAWSGHNTTLDALHGGSLVLCMEGLFMRQRHTAALMQYLGFVELVAKDKAGLVDLCARHAFDTEYRQAYKVRLAAKLPALANRESVHSFGDFLIRESSTFTPVATEQA